MRSAVVGISRAAATNLADAASTSGAVKPAPLVGKGAAADDADDDEELARADDDEELTRADDEETARTDDEDVGRTLDADAALETELEDGNDNWGMA